MPVLDAIKAKYPQADVTVLAGPRPRELFEYNPAVRDMVVYDKHDRAREKLRLVLRLAARRFDMVVDMRNSLLGLLLPGAIRACRLIPRSQGRRHMKDIHSDKVSGLRIPGAIAFHGVSFPILNADRQAAADILKNNGITGSDRIVIVSAGARSTIKRWQKEKFAALIDKLVRLYHVRIILIGDQDDVPIGEYLAKQCGHPVVDLTGKTTFSQTAALLQRAKLLVTNDSANLHAASYLNVPVVAVFGPTDDVKYGPWSQRCAIVKKEIFCRPCCKAQCRFGTLACMSLVTVEDVLRQAVRFLDPDFVSAAVQTLPDAARREAHKRILIVRTDRMGDMILSTPVLKAMRQEYPNAYIAVLVRPYTRAVVEGNPYIDEVIVYDKKEYDRSLARFFGFISMLRRRRFDLALVLHPTVRDHLIVFLSGIRKRVGYNRKMGVLLTDRIFHDKQQGAKHESEYALDMVRFLGIEPRDKELFVPVNAQAEQWAENLFRASGIKLSERVVVINPGASCPSKIWLAERYAAVADALTARGCKIIILAGPDILDKNTARGVIRHMKTKAIDCIGTVPIPETASLFRRSSLVISADTGPMHIAAAVGVPLIAIFGRNQPGVGPKRWGPINVNSVVLHKDVGCIDCRAHDCIKGFACLAAISVEDVLAEAERLLNLKE